MCSLHYYSYFGALMTVVKYMSGIRYLPSMFAIMILIAQLWNHAPEVAFGMFSVGDAFVVGHAVEDVRVPALPVRARPVRTCSPRGGISCNETHAN